MFSSTTVFIFTLSVCLRVFHGVESITYVCTDSAYYNPVCASDGKTYANSKVVYCINASSGQNLQIVAYQPCSNSSPIPQINCNNCWSISGTDPVCGIDGINYPSLQSLQCFSGCENRYLRVLITGSCPANLCSCSNLGRSFPVCGSDGRSYRNADVLTCLNGCQGTNTQIVSTSACPNHSWLNQQSLHFPTK